MEEVWKMPQRFTAKRIDKRGGLKHILTVPAWTREEAIAKIEKQLCTPDRIKSYNRWVQDGKIVHDFAF